MSQKAKVKQRKPNKIEQELTPKQVQKFVQELVNTPGLTLAKIRSMAFDKWGVRISIQAASNFRSKNIAPYLRRLEDAQLYAEAFRTNDPSASNQVLSDTCAALLSQDILDLLAYHHSRIQQQKEADEPIDINIVNQLSLAITRLRSGDQRAKELQLKLDEANRKEEERMKRAKKVQKDKNLTPEQRSAALADILRVDL